MFRRLRGLAALILALVPGAISAQAVPESLSLAEAMELARLNNPIFLASQNDVDVADWDVKSA